MGVLYSDFSIKVMIILFQVRTKSGEVRSVKFGIVIIAAGPFSAEVARMARIGTGKGILSIPLPVEPRYRIPTLVFLLIWFYMECSMTMNIIQLLSQLKGNWVFTTDVDISYMNEYPQIFK